METETISAVDVRPGDAIQDTMRGRLRLVISNVDERGRRLIYTHEGYFSLPPHETVLARRGMTRAEVDRANEYI